MRAIVFLLFVILVFLIIRFVLNRVIEIRAENRKKEALENGDENNNKNKSEAMVQCAQCGIHLPQSSAYYDGKDTFCSEGHMRDFQQKQSD